MLSSSIAFIFIAFITVPMLLIPSPIHWKAKNAGTVLIIGWTTLGNITDAISVIVLLNAQSVTAPHWCDFAAAVKYTWRTGCCMGGLILLRRLTIIASTQSANKSKDEKLKVFLIEMTLGLLIPILQVIFHLVVQGHRLDEIQDFGCFAPIYPSVASIFLVMVYPVTITVISAIYGALAIRSLMVRRKEFYRVLNNENTGITRSHYLRLMALGIIDLALWLPMSLAFLIIDVTNLNLRPYISWSHVHSGFNKIGFVLVSELMQHSYTDYIAAELSRWIGPAIALNFFIFFGVKPEIWKYYNHHFMKLLSVITCTAITKHQEQEHQQHDCTPTTSTNSFRSSCHTKLSDSLRNSLNSASDLDIEKAESLAQ